MYRLTNIEQSCKLNLFVLSTERKIKMGLFNGLFGTTPSQRREQEAKVRRDEVVSEHGPRAARNILRMEDPGRYERSQVSDFDDSWDFPD